ncbi:hypothetical protein [Pectobacterium parmentieri]|uniref:Uncharacterized protein n=1 Tax=Pectobacterium parmentieri TaxID=1905730 RepID=A0A0H3HYQ9_PECPM|nr:hypothetical protein [Pectobacterium parmentieri]AFI88514.1 Hypothetical protein W5S_0387 [Pectobacterium parmentieri]
MVYTLNSKHYDQTHEDIRYLWDGDQIAEVQHDRDGELVSRRHWIHNGWELLVQQRQNAAGKLYVTDALMSPNDIMRYLLITDPLHVGRSDYAIIFKADSVQMSNIKRFSMLEYIHSGKIKLNDVLYPGSNPYSIASNMNYEDRNKLTLNQISMRGKFGVRK